MTMSKALMTEIGAVFEEGLRAPTMTSLRQKSKDACLALSQRKEVATDLTVVVLWYSHQGFRTREMSGEKIEAGIRSRAGDVDWAWAVVTP